LKIQNILEASMSRETTAGSGLGSNRRVLAICWIVYGVARLAGAVWLVLFGGTATVMFGALLQRVADPFTLMGIFHFGYVCMIILSALSGIVGLLAGFALLGAGGRKLALLAALLSVSEVPFGTTLGIYTMVIFLP
jgi:hypothetical protein